MSIDHEAPLTGRRARAPIQLHLGLALFFLGVAPAVPAAAYMLLYGVPWMLLALASFVAIVVATVSAYRGASTALRVLTAIALAWAAFYLFSAIVGAGGMELIVLGLATLILAGVALLVSPRVGQWQAERRGDHAAASGA